MKNYLRHEGYCYKRVGPPNGGSPPGDAAQDVCVANGYACAKDRSDLDDERVEIWFRPRVGYYAISPWAT